MYKVRKTEKLFGEIELNGAKNAALPIIVASCLTDERVTLRNVPIELNDIRTLIDILNEMGFNINILENNELEIHNKNYEINENTPKRASQIRSSLLFLSLLLQKTGKVKVPYPGGCSIGNRKHDIHIDSLSKMGANITETQEYIIGELDGKFKGENLDFYIATTSGTENVILGAVLGEGKTIIRNANTRPEVIDLIKFLNSIGADIEYKTRYIEIKGVNKLHGGDYRVMSGRDEAVTYMILAGMTRGEIKIKKFSVESIKTDVNLLRDIGLNIFEWGDDIFVSAKNKKLNSFSMATSPYPGINSDMQPLFAALAATIKGESIITDMRFKDRFQYVEEFKRFGIDINNYNNCAIVQGGKRILGAKVKATDLRCGAALMLLGSIADGETEINKSHQIDRGYIDLKEKLNNIGTKITVE